MASGSWLRRARAPTRVRNPGTAFLLSQLGGHSSLEARGWIERRANARDRRASALHLTDQGRDMLVRIMVVSAEHEAELTRGLEPERRATLIDLLLAVATEQGLVRGVHPGFVDDDADQTREKPHQG